MAWLLELLELIVGLGSEQELSRLEGSIRLGNRLPPT